MFVHRSIVAGDGYQIVVRVDDPPAVGRFPPGLPAALVHLAQRYGRIALVHSPEQ